MIKVVAAIIIVVVVLLLEIIQQRVSLGKIWSWVDAVANAAGDLAAELIIFELFPREFGGLLGELVRLLVLDVVDVGGCLRRVVAWGCYSAVLFVRKRWVLVYGV